MGDNIFFKHIGKSEFSFHYKNVSASGVEGEGLGLCPQSPHYSYNFSICSFRLRIFLISVLKQSEIHHMLQWLLESFCKPLSLHWFINDPCMKCSVAFGNISSERLAFLSRTLLLIFPDSEAYKYV